MSGGGVTFSGGEPLMQWSFVSDVIQLLNGVHIAIETSGYAADEVFTDAMEKCNLIMMDWKVSDPALHRRYTGVDQDIILRHVRMLAEGSTPFILRMPIIPGVSDNEAHFETAASLVKGSSSFVRIDVLPYQRAAGAKYEMVGMQYQTDFDESAAPRLFPHVFEKAGVAFQLFR
jgi:pyruvate formate lyase activating enzyme